MKITFKAGIGMGRYLVFNGSTELGEVYKTRYLKNDMWKVIGLKDRMFSSRAKAAAYLVKCTPLEKVS